MFPYVLNSISNNFLIFFFENMAYKFFCVFYNLYEKIKNKLTNKKKLKIPEELESNEDSVSNEDMPPSYDEINQTQIDLPQLDQNTLNLSQIELNSGNETYSNVSYGTAHTENNSALFAVAKFIIENHHKNQ